MGPVRAAKCIDSLDLDRDCLCSQDMRILDIKIYGTVHFTAVVCRENTTHMSGQPFPIQVAALSLSESWVRHPTTLSWLCQQYLRPPRLPSWSPMDRTHIGHRCALLEPSSIQGPLCFMQRNMRWTRLL